MSETKKSVAVPDRHDESAEGDTSTTSTFNVQVYTHEGRFLSEYEMDSENDNVHTISEAKESAQIRIGRTSFESVVLVISEQTLTKMRQIQTTVSAALGRTAPLEAEAQG